MLACENVPVNLVFTLSFLFFQSRMVFDFFFLYPHLNDTQALLRLPKTWLEKLWGKVKALFESWKCQVSAPQAPNALSLSLRLLLGPASDTHAHAKSESMPN